MVPKRKKQERSARFEDRSNDEGIDKEARMLISGLVMTGSAVAASAAAGYSGWQTNDQPPTPNLPNNGPASSYATL